jgi:uncharacterized glyoxalase superfamily protein PhnB
VRKNRSIPAVTVIPELAYEDVAGAAAWLCDTFGFTERLRIGTHRIQLTIGTGASRGAMVVTASTGGRAGADHAVMVRVEDVRAHHAHAVARHARIANVPADHPYGERQYTAIDIGGHRWTFTQSIADVDPRTWGAEWRGPDDD